MELADKVLKLAEELRLAVAEAGCICDLEAGDIEGVKAWEKKIHEHKQNLKQWNKNALDY